MSASSSFPFKALIKKTRKLVGEDTGNVGIESLLSRHCWPKLKVNDTATE